MWCFHSSWQRWQKGKKAKRHLPSALLLQSNFKSLSSSAFLKCCKSVSFENKSFSTFCKGPRSSRNETALWWQFRKNAKKKQQTKPEIEKKIWNVFFLIIILKVLCGENISELFISNINSLDFYEVILVIIQLLNFVNNWFYKKK